jgi:hypothetical protein
MFMLFARFHRGEDIPPQIGGCSPPHVHIARIRSPALAAWFARL